MRLSNYNENKLQATYFYLIQNFLKMQKGAWN